MASLLNMSGGSLLKKGGLLPAGYTQLEYIENTSTAYINTGIILPQNFTIKTTWSISAYREYGFLCGARRGTNVDSFTMLLSSSNFGIDINNTQFRGSFRGVGLNQFYDIECIVEAGHTILKVDDVVRLDVQLTPNVSGFPMYIFDVNTAGKETIYKGLYKLKSFSIDGILNLIPCISPNNVVGMYDIVEGQFYSSPNGVAFVAGPVVS